MLAELMRLKQGIAIAGTHGKTTTTSPGRPSVLIAAGAGPDLRHRRRLAARARNARAAATGIVVEADESDASFLNLLPVLAVVTNIDADHMDTYGHDLASCTGLRRFLHRMPFYGAAILCVGRRRPCARVVPTDLAARSATASSGRGARGGRATCAPGAQMRFVAQRRNARRAPGRGPLNLPGEHNVLNALAAIAVARPNWNIPTRRCSVRWPGFRASAPLPALWRAAGPATAAAASR